MKISDDEKTELLKEALVIAERTNMLLEQCYHAHCNAVGIKP